MKCLDQMMMTASEKVDRQEESIWEKQRIIPLLSCTEKSSYVPVCQLAKGIYLFK